MMRAKAFLGLLFAALVYLVVMVRAAPATFSCAGLPNGDYQDSTSCSHYYSCTNGLATRQKCAPSTLFDASLGRCNEANQVKNCDTVVNYSTMTTAHDTTVTPPPVTSRSNVTTSSPTSTTTGNSNNNVCQTQCTGNFVCDETSGQCVCNNFYWGHLCALRKPNYVMIVIDDLGSTDVTWSPYQQQYSPDIETPNMEKLAAEQGVILDNYYVDPMCTPSRSQLLFSVHPIFTNLQNFVIRGAQRNSVPIDVKSLADKLRGEKDDYQCYMQGKWHLGHYRDDVLPVRRGFHNYLGMVHGASNHYSRVAEETFNCAQDDIFAADCQPSANTTCVTYAGTDLFDGINPVTGDDLKTEKHSTDLLTDRFFSDLDNYLEFHKNKPFFMHLNYLANHYPLVAAPGYETQYWKIKRAAQGGSLTAQQQQRANYAAMLKHVDQRVSEIVQRLKDEGLWQHTILVVTNDNGGYPYASGSNYPLRGSKFTLFQGGVKGVGFIASPYIEALTKVAPDGTSKMPKRTSLLMHISDFYPTFLSLAGKANSIEQSDPVKYPTSGYTFWYNLGEPFVTQRDHVLLNIDPVTACRGPSIEIDGFNLRQRAGIIDSDGFKLLTGDPVTSGNGNWCDPINDPSCVAEDDPDDEEKNLWMFHLPSDFDERNDISNNDVDRRNALISRLKNYQDKMIAAQLQIRLFSQDKEAQPGNGMWIPWGNSPNDQGDYCSKPSPRDFNEICYQPSLASGQNNGK